MPENPEDSTYFVTIAMNSGHVLEFETRTFEIEKSGADLRSIKWSQPPGATLLQFVKIENIDSITSRKKS